MKILSLEQADFGTLAINQPVQFAPGLNILVAPNQSGKSTLLTLIEWLLYGVPPKSSRRNESLRKEWAPWDGTTSQATMLIAPEREGWPSSIKLEVQFEAHGPVLTDTQTLEDISSRIKVSNNGTWDLGLQLTGLSRTAFQASILAHQGKMEDVLREEELRKAVISDLSELVEDPDRANLEAALSELEKPTFTMGEGQKTQVQLPTLLRNTEEIYKMATGDYQSKADDYADLEKLLSERETSEQREAVEAGKLAKLKSKLTEQSLAAAHWRFSQIDKLTAQLDTWEPKLAERPWLKDFPFDLEQEAEIWQAGYKQLGQEIDRMQGDAKNLAQRLQNLKHHLDEKQQLVPLIGKTTELAELDATIGAAQSDYNDADSERSEYGEASDPVTRERFEQLKAQLEPYADQLAELVEWETQNAAAAKQRSELSEREAELKQVILPGRPWQLYLALALLAIGLALVVVGAKFINPAFAAYVAGAVAVALAAWLGMQSSRTTRESDKAAVQLEQVVMPKLKELLEVETKLEAQAAALMAQCGVTEGDWNSITTALPEYKNLRLKLDRYAQACNERDAAQKRLEEAWGKVVKLTGNAPPNPDRAWIAELINELNQLREFRDQLEDGAASQLEIERDIAQRKEEREVRVNKLATQLEVVGLGDSLKLDVGKALLTLSGYAREAQEYQRLLAAFNNEQDKSSSLDTNREGFTAALAQLSPAAKEETQGMVRDEEGYEKLVYSRRQQQQTISQLEESAKHAHRQASSLREKLARIDSVITGLPLAQQAQAEAKENYESVRRWDRALYLLTQTLQSLQSELASNLAPKLTEELRSALAKSPVAGITDAALGHRLELRLEIEGAPPGLEGEDAIERLSLGAQRQLALAVRIAIARTLSGHANLPILLDEPLAELDDRRSSDWLAYLSRLAEGNQVLITSCHEAQYDWLVKHTGVTPSLLNLGEIA